MQVQPLDPMIFPLHGARLIEASAGTGKTFTLAALYLRLLLGHGNDDHAFERPLGVSEILVVTFTEAATQELRDRIRARIHQARLAFYRVKVRILLSPHCWHPSMTISRLPICCFRQSSKWMKRRYIPSTDSASEC